LNQAELAVAIGTGPSAISEIENGKRNPNSTTLLKLAHALEVEVAELFPKVQAQLFDGPDAPAGERRVPLSAEEKLKSFAVDEQRIVWMVVDREAQLDPPDELSYQAMHDFTARRLGELGLTFDEAREALPRANPLLAKEAEDQRKRVQGLKSKARRRSTAANETA